MSPAGRCLTRTECNPIIWFLRSTKIV